MGVWAKKKILFCGLAFCWAARFASAQPPVVLDGNAQSVSISGHLHFLKDPTRRLTLPGAMRKTAAFQPFRQTLPNLGSTEAAVWLRFSVVNNVRDDWFLEIGNSLLEDITFYKLKNGRVLAERRAGFYHPFARRDLESNFYLFSLFPPSETPPDTLVCYLRITNSMPMQFPLQIITARKLSEENHPIDIANGIYLGIMLVMALYNLFIYSSVRDRIYLYYVGYVLFSSLVIGDFQGYIFDLLWRDTWWWLPRVDYIPAMLANVFAILFARHFLDTATHTPRLHKGIKWLIASSILTIAAGLAVTFSGMERYKVWCELTIQLVVFVSAVYFLGIGILLLLRNKRAALFYVLAWTIFLTGTAIFILQIDGIVANNFFTEHAIQIGSAIETMLLSLALADRINTYKKDKEAAQNRYIRQLQENDQVRNRLARDLHDDLGSTLSSISILSQVAQHRHLSEPTQTGELLERISHNAQKMMDTMHDIVWATQPDNDSLGDVAVRMREFAAEVLEAKNIPYQIRVDDALLPLKLPAKRHYDFYMVFKETINNIAKYSGATMVRVEMTRLNGRLHLRVEDNGAGFDVAMVKNGNGLKNMEKRTQALGGDFALVSRPGHGTSIEVTLAITR